MSDDQDARHRQSIRLRDFDYASRGAYFVTTVSERRRCLFGEIIDDQLLASRLGEIAAEEWLAGPSHRPEFEFGSYCLMPNHLHAIVRIVEPVVHEEGDPRIAPTRRGLERGTIGALISGYKSAVTKRFRRETASPDVVVWQRNYYEHVIRDQEELNKIEAYILDNPRRWTDDAENPSFIASRSD